MKVAILTFDGFNELDSFIAAGILNRMKNTGWDVQITSPTPRVTSMNGVEITAQQPLEFANHAEIVLVGSGIYTRDIAEDTSILNQLTLDPTKQFIGAQCSGALILSALGLLKNLPACTDLTTKPWLQAHSVEVLEQAFYAKGNIATAGGCLASVYLATWVLSKAVGQEATKSALHYVAPVGEKATTVDHCLAVVSPYL
ncbi:DJ-1/PfpI family protein [Marinomonas sp.]